MMVTNIEKDIVRVIILDISGVYAQIHDQGYFTKEEISDIQKKHSDTQHWRVVVSD